MRGLRWLGRGARAVGKVVAYPVTKPVDLLAQRAGKRVVEGAVDQMKDEIAEAVAPSPPRPPRPPRIGPPAPSWTDFAKYLIEFVWLKWKHRKG